MNLRSQKQRCLLALAMINDPALGVSTELTRRGWIRSRGARSGIWCAVFASAARQSF